MIRPTQKSKVNYGDIQEGEFVVITNTLDASNNLTIKKCVRCVEVDALGASQPITDAKIHYMYEHELA